MNLNGMRWPVVIAAVLATFGLLFAGVKIYQKQAVDRPLFKLYQEIKEVKEVQVEKAEGQMVIRVRLDRVDDLQTTYRRLDSLARSVLGRDGYRLEIGDNRTQVLEQAFYRMHFSLQEANTTGNFTEMAQEIENQQKLLDIESSRLFIDNENLYLALDHRGAYLYEIIPRLGGRERSKGERGFSG